MLLCHEYNLVDILPESKMQLNNYRNNCFEFIGNMALYPGRIKITGVWF